MAIATTSIADRVRKVSSAGWEGTPLQPGSRFNNITYEDRVIEVLRPKTILDRVANLSFVDNVQCGYPRARISEPQGYVQGLEEDGQPKPQEYEYGCETHMDVEYGFTSLRKLSKEAKQKFECNDPRYLEMLMNADTKEARLVLERLGLYLMVAGVNGRNQGQSAGVTSGCYNLGSPVNPIVWNPESAEEAFQDLLMVFKERNIEVKGMGMEAPFLVGPTFMEKAIYNNDRLTSYYQQGNCVSCPRITGVLSNTLYGMEMMTSDCLPTYKLDGKTVYPILAGFKHATDVVVEFEQVEKHYHQVGDRSHLFEKYWDIGIKVWDGRYLAVAWIVKEDC